MTGRTTSIDEIFNGATCIDVIYVDGWVLHKVEDFSVCREGITCRHGLSDWFVPWQQVRRVVIVKRELAPREERF